MSNVAVFDWFEQGWEIVKDQEAFLAKYPKPKYGEYRPQPRNEPEKYPCLMKELATVDNPNGADRVFIAYIYDYEPGFKRS